MKPFLVTLTGADETVEPQALAELSAEFPFVEWAILIAADREGRPRFPHAAWRQAVETLPGLNRSAHLCGGALKAFVDSDPVLLSELEAFQRIQLNFNAQRLNAGVQAGLLAATQRMAEARPEVRVITQHNKANVLVWREYEALPNTQVLFDASGGNGVLPASWPLPLPGRVCGYAGGLGPDTIQEALPGVSKAVGDQAHWIDMESRLRVDERFDLDKCRQVLEHVQKTSEQIGLF